MNSINVEGNMENIDELKERIKYLEKENRYLKCILDKAGISYNTSGENYDYQINQGDLIVHKKDFTEKDATLFFSMFWGRTDVYSQRTVSKSTGLANYYPQCYNFWKNNCPKKNNKKIKCSECRNASFVPLDKKKIINHLKGLKDDGSDVIGVYPLFPDNTCRFIVFDFDNHEKDDNKSNENNCIWKDEVNTLRKICELNDIDALVERSKSGDGAHLWIFFEKRISAKLARNFGNALLRKGTESVNMTTFNYYDRLIPMQDCMPKGGFGNLIALPLQGQALKQGNSAFVDENWNAYPNQWKILLTKKKLSEETIKEKIKAWGNNNVDMKKSIIDGFDSVDENPWNQTNNFIYEHVTGDMHITLSDAIYIKKDNLKPRIQNRIREMAAFKNPVFYKNQAMDLSNYNQARYIYLGNDINDYIRIPRGLLDRLKESCDKEGIKFKICDERCYGKKINVEFNGKLKDIQVNAVEKLDESDNGILNAATAFGKTVVCCNMIARKKVNTLILLQSSALIEQWEESLKKFLIIDEGYPEYKTPSGRVKKRKSLIGRIQGAHDSSTGIIDIGMVGSLCKKGNYHSRLKEYGMVIVDECHHAASDTVVDILQTIKAKYVYGVTATPKREDGLEKINYMLLGPIRFKYTSKERAEDQGIDHLVYPRFTRAVSTSFTKGKIHPNEAYEILRNNNDRDSIIVSDVKECIRQKRTPVILSKYVDHSEKIYKELQGCADYVFWLSGRNSKKEHKEILDRMSKVSNDESMVLIATGSLIGEGFDFPRLDTLIMAMPVSGKSVVEQYAGRLNRDFDDKKNVVILDYIDIHIPMFSNMYNKRLKAYKQIGFNICTEDINNSIDEEINSIFDIDNYIKVYQKDLLSAKESIVISSPTISNQKVEDMINMLRDKQLQGIRIVVITWKPDEYNFGEPAYWMQLHERMRTSGFEVNLADNFCEHYCIIDNNIVWYGSLNFLGKEDIEDNLMRVKSECIASELLELTFGNNNQVTGRRL